MATVSITNEWYDQELKSNLKTEKIVDPDTNTKKIIEYYDNGNLKSEFHFLNNKKHGLQITYYPNKRIDTSIEYNNGKKEGKYLKYYDNENNDIKTITHYKNNEKNGTHQEYYPGNNIKKEYYYENNKQINKQIDYYKNGKKSKIEEYTYDEDVYNIHKFNENEELIYLYVKNKKNIIEQSYNNNLKLRYEEIIKDNGDKSIKEYYYDGKPKYIYLSTKCSNCSNIKKISDVAYYKDGKVEYEIYYEDNCSNTRKSETYYYESGNIKKEIKRNSNNRDEYLTIIEYYDTQQKQINNKYFMNKSDNKHGISSNYSIDGKLILEELYNNGILKEIRKPLLKIHNDNNCCICCEDFIGSFGNIIIINCGHSFHLACLKENKNNNCPICRSLYKI